MDITIKHDFLTKSITVVFIQLRDILNYVRLYLHARLESFDIICHREAHLFSVSIKSLLLTIIFLFSRLFLLTIHLVVCPHLFRSFIALNIPDRLYQVSLELE